MSGFARREQLVAVGRSLFAEKGFGATSVEHIIAEQFKRSDFDTTWSPLYAQMLVGLIAQVGQWWLDDRRMKKDEVAAHVVNLIWNGQRGLRPHPTLRVRSGEGR